VPAVGLGVVLPSSGSRRRENARTSLVRRIRQLYLDRFVLPRLGNVEGNRRLWDSYAGAWRQDEAYLDVELSEADAAAWREQHVHLVGDEWGTPEDVDRVLEDFVFPHLRPDSTVAEIGIGGGRIAARVAPRVAELWGFDISKGMIRRSREALAENPNVRLVLLEEASLPTGLDDRFAFAYSFDVFPHLDLHVQYRYLRQLHALLGPGGRAMVHTANLRAPDGWKRFASQPAPSIRGFFFVTPETVDLLAEQAGFLVERRSEVDPSNFYYRRDYVVLLRKPE
jgi:SAM-dependent methyltransferase